MKHTDDGEPVVGDLGDQLTLTQPAVSKHLKALRDAGLVEPDNHGTGENP